MLKIFDIYIFTASEKEYADVIIKEVAPFVPDSRRFYVDSITHSLGVHVKDLSKIGLPLSKVILIDNSQSSGLYQPNNLLLINSWFGDANDDTLLSELVPILKEASCESNILLGASKAIQMLNPKNISLLTLL